MVDVSATRQAVRHGLVTEPASRAALYLDERQAADLAAGKFFPALEPGLADPYARDDVVNGLPPADGQIASVGRPYAARLDEPRPDWQKHPVSSGQRLRVTWTYQTRHRTRRWNYFLTRDGWNTRAPLGRGQFEPAPLHSVQLSGQPFWEADLLPPQPTTHTMKLPPRQGHQVLLAVWEIADTPIAFYQVVDLDFTDPGAAA